MKLHLLLLALACLIALVYGGTKNYYPSRFASESDSDSSDSSGSDSENPPWPQFDPSHVYKGWELPADELAFHEGKMKEAIELAISRNAVFASTIVNATSGETVCQSVNSIGKTKDMTMHGEMTVMQNCSSIYGLLDWTGFYIYTTGESCPMCQSAIMWNSFSKIIFGTNVTTLYCNMCLTQILVESAAINSMGYGLADWGEYVPAQIIGGIMSSVTDSMFINYCNEPNSPVRVTPNCSGSGNSHNKQRKRKSHK
ncbi:hypothetical protein DLAC_11439 [Tieghemostelium lacteum]|uniref:CMP/dCMP-type deaminase domain-containing protein n=1 Tax=Tieghemostelium lacteum TaxID=361077 RepID=A0A152A9H3_TIELA|nr:hypothetical protein DLAC_11439 [Tieghemostelium lacteum]|eukprot:KYR02873.1 hypothetical protein DLAC_11439 [Tieghemostelium lacteum]